MSPRRPEYLTVRARPSWLRLFVDAEPRSVQARVDEGVLRLWIKPSEGPRRAFVVRRAVGAGLSISVKEKSGEQPVSVAPEQLRAQAAPIAAFVERMAWIQDLAGDGSRGWPYTPTPTERELADAYRHVRARDGRHTGDAATEDARPAPKVETQASIVFGVDVYLDLAAGRWQRLLPLADDPTALSALDSWLVPAVLAVSGDIAALRAVAAHPVEDPSPLSVYEGLVLQSLRFDARAYETMRAGLACLEPRERASYYVALADLAAVIEGPELAVRSLQWAVAVRPDDDHQLLRAVGNLIRYGGFGPAWEVLLARAEREPARLDVYVELATLALWCGDREGAVQWIGRAGGLQADALEVRRADAIRKALDGDVDEALAALLELEPNADAQTLCWIAELYARKSDVESSLRYIELARARAQTLVHTLLEVVVTREIQPGFNAALETLGVQPADESDIDAAVAAAKRAIATLHGNRTELLTCTPGVEPDRPSALRLVPIPPRDMLLVSRDAAAELLKTIRTRPVEELHDEFRTLVERYPDSPHPWCYWGELRLWLGELDEARACFEHEAARIARWAFVGRAAVHIHRGDFEQALAEFEALSKAYSPVPGATTHVYLGELYWMRGDHDAALRELHTSVDVKPGRVSAHVLIALCEHAKGNVDAAVGVYRRLLAQHPRLFWDVAQALSFTWPLPEERLPEILEATLRLMRGNRSSHTITYIDTGGRLRLVTDAAAIAEDAGKRSYLVERAILDRLMR